MLGRLCALVSLAGGLATAGCAAKVPPFDPDALRATTPRTLVVAVDRSPPITSEGPVPGGVRPGVPILIPALIGGPVVAALVGGAMGGAMAAGQYQAANQKRARWMRGCDLDDPVDDIRADVAETLTSALSLHLLEPTHRTKAKDPEDVIQDYPGVDLILDIRTSRWGIHDVKGQRPKGKVHFAAGYDGSLRLIDARKRAVVAEASCSVQFSNGDDPPTITELLEDDCALLDKGLMLSAQTCAKRLREALGLE
jgi:hypothetical protein